MKVLITGGGTATCMSVLKGLRAQREIPVHVIVADNSGEVAARHLADGFLRVPLATEPGFLDTVQQFCREQAIDLLIPIVDYEFDALSRAAPSFLAQGTRVAISRPEVIQLCSDKLAFAGLVRKAGLHSAAIFSPQDVYDGRAPFPLFVKPRRGGRASLGATKVTTPAEFEAALQQVSDPLIQEFVDGEEFTIDALCDFDGRFIAAMPRLRLETKAGVSVKGHTLDSPELVAIAQTLLESLPIHGPANLQVFRRRADQALLVSEVNPRFAGALALSLASGFNSPGLLLKLARGEKIDATALALRHGVRMFRYWQEVFVEPDGTPVIDPWPRLASPPASGPA